MSPQLEQNYYDFEEQRLPGGLYETNADGTKGGPNVEIVKRSTVCDASSVLFIIFFFFFLFLLIFLFSYVSLAFYTCSIASRGEIRMG